MRFHLAVVSLSATVCLALTGCTLQTATTVPTPASFSGISGRAMGGQQPITGSTIYVVEASATAATKVLNGNGVITDANGAFKLAGTYSCSGAANQVYLLAIGGNPGLAAGTNNSSIALVTALGPCPTTGGDLSASFPFVTMNEATTVAAAYALAPSATGPMAVTLLSTGSGQAAGSAIQTANNLVNPVTGSAYTMTPNGNGTVPVTTINTLANAIAACVNTDGTIAAKSNGPPATPATACYTLLYSAPNRAGTVPADTFTALLNLAQNPGFAFDSFGTGSNLGNIYGLSSATAPFQPALTAQPSDLTLEVTYTGGGLNGTQSRPRSVAVDGAGNIWTINPNTVSELNYLGVPISPATGFTGVSASPLAPAFSSLTALAGNFNGNMAILDQGTNTGNGSLRELNQSGTVQSYYTGLSGPVDVVATSYGAITYAVAGNYNSVYGLTLNGTTFTTTATTNAALNQPVAITYDGTYTYVANATGNGLTRFSGAAITYNNQFVSKDSGVQASLAYSPNGAIWVSVDSSNGNNTTGVSRFLNSNFTGPFNNPNMVNHSYSLAIDKLKDVWVTSQGPSQSPMYVLNDAGTNIAGAHGLVAEVIPTSVAIDSFGNVWFRNANDGTLRELVGSAAPASAPIVAAFN